MCICCKITGALHIYKGRSVVLDFYITKTLIKAIICSDAKVIIEKRAGKSIVDPGYQIRKEKKRQYFKAKNIIIKNLELHLDKIQYEIRVVRNCYGWKQDKQGNEDNGTLVPRAKSLVPTPFCSIIVTFAI